MKLLNFLKPKTPKSTIESYGQPTEVSPEIQAVMEWLFASLLMLVMLGELNSLTRSRPKGTRLRESARAAYAIARAPEERSPRP
ncbi:MAG: hypothetical protein HC836_42610 [Richelia sp. RM2_1_2]|nr:hypothetical protein [Richelia sp. RM2_1_2]